MGGLIEQDKKLFELVKEIMGDERYYDIGPYHIERISDLLAFKFIEDYHFISSTDNISFSICKVNGQEKYLFFDYSKEHEGYKTCSVEEAIVVINNLKK
jgi:hypothetical protein